MSPPMPHAVCIECGGEKVRKAEQPRAGEWHYEPCARCGGIGIRLAADLYVPPQTKKAKVVPYENSPYRGGKLVKR